MLNDGFPREAAKRGPSELMRLHGRLIRRRPTEDDGVDSIFKRELILNASLGRGGVTVPTPQRTLMVRCTRCGELRPEYDFAPDLRKRNGLQSHCLSCHRQHMREYRREKKASVTSNVM